MSSGISTESTSGKRICIYSPREARLRAESDYFQPRTVFISGPTGCGKTALSLRLAEAVDGEIVSADSMQVYRGMDIGTAKATLAQQATVPHHLLDIRNVAEPFNVVDFYHEAQSAMEDIALRGKIPIVVGGAGFYLHALLYGPPAGPPSVAELREQIQAEMEDRGPEALYDDLRGQDPDYAATITPHDRQKIVRALEIIRLTGFTVSSLSWKAREPSVQGDFLCWFLFRPRHLLYERVEARCEEMLKDGFLEEVQRLDEAGIRQNRSAAGAIGYRQALEYLDSSQTAEDYTHFVEEFKKSSRRYVKRQFTWFRREPLFNWLDVDAHDLEVLLDMMVSRIRLL